jgi:hypothetical protein
MLQKTASLVVLAFLGGSVPTEHGLLDEHLSLEYDSTLHKIQCETLRAQLTRPLTVQLFWHQLPW